MRPTSIVYFERLSLLSIFVGVAFAMMTWDSEMAAARASGLGTAYVPLVQGFCLALLLLLIFLISRKAVAAAKWILVILFAIGVVLIGPQMLKSLDDGLVALLLVTQVAVQAAALYFLFTPEARGWFAGKPG